MRTRVEAEWKFPLARISLPDLGVLLRPYMRELVHDMAVPVSFVRTFYLDTPDLRYLRSASPRRQVRVRQYAAGTSEDVTPAPTGECYVERKETAAHRCSTLRIPVAFEVVDELMAPGGSRNAWRRAMAQESALHALADAMTALRPVAMSWYRRRTLIDAHGSVRAAIDTGVHLGAPSPLVPPVHLPRGEDVVVFTCADTPPPWLSAIMRTLGAPIVSSKYEPAIAAARAHAPGSPRPAPDTWQ